VFAANACHQRAPRHDRPSLSEISQAARAAETIQTFAQPFTDADLVEAFGPDAVLPVEIGFIPQVQYRHCPPIACRAGDVYALLHAAMDLPKAQLPLIVPARLLAPAKGLRARRNIASVAGVSFVTGDFDRGDAPLEAACARMREIGLSGVVYRSPSDGKDSSEILRCKGLISDTGAKELCAPTVEAVLAKMVADGYRAEVLGALTIADPEKVEREQVKYRNSAGEWVRNEVVRTKIVVKHNPLAKTRVMCTLKTPFCRLPGEAANAFNARWVRDVLEPVFHALGFVADPSCKDVSRAYYLPSSIPPSGAATITDFVTGPALDIDGALMAAWRKAVERPLQDRTLEQKKRETQRRQSSAAAGLPVGRHDLAALIYAYAPDRVRGEKEGLIIAECPFDELHSNCGAPTDKAFWCTRSGKAGCYHSHGEEHSAADYLAKMIADGWFTAKQAQDHAIRERPNGFAVMQEYLEGASKKKAS
jgi:hypothetical protein